jgi:hypothetical protein
MLFVLAILAAACLACPISHVLQQQWSQHQEDVIKQPEQIKRLFQGTMRVPTE